MHAKKAPLLQMKYGVNAFADSVYENYEPLQITAHYPSSEADELKKDIANYVERPADMILVGSGSDEMVDAYIRTYARLLPGMKVAYSPPAYFQYEAYTSRIGAPIIHLPHDRPSLRPEVLKAVDCDPKDTILMLDSPSNPAGEIIGREQFMELLDAGYHVFADEAYYEFYGKSVIDVIERYPKQLVVSRSFSKFAAMAGSRVGYIIADPELITRIRPQKLFFNVASSSQHRARYALKHVEEFKQAIAVMRATKKRFLDEVAALNSYTLHPALDLYTIFSHKRMPASQLYRTLQTDHNIETYLIGQFKDSGAVIRATVMQPPLMQRLSTALKAAA